MATVIPLPPSNWTIADLLDHLGVPPHRVRLYPTPGTGTEQDVIEIEAREDRLCELVDGILVEKAMGFYESYLAIQLATLLNYFVTQRKLGIVAGPDGMMRLSFGLVRIPDVSFVSWDRLPNRQVPREPIPALAPDLAVEVLSESNTPKEMKRKLRDYFDAGVRLVWFVDPQNRTVEVFTSPDESTLLSQEQTLDGGVVLPGFTLPLEKLFAEPGGKN